MGKVRDFEMPANPFSKSSRNLRGVGSEEFSKFRSLLLGENFEEKSSENENFDHQNDDFLDFEKPKSGLFLIYEDDYDSSKDPENKICERNSLSLGEQESIGDMVDSMFGSTVREVELNLSNSNSLERSQNYRPSNFRTSNPKANRSLNLDEKKELSSIFDNMFSSTAREVLSNFENLKAEAEENGANFKSSVKWGTSLGAPRVENNTNFSPLEHPQNYRPSNFRTSNPKANRSLNLDEKKELSSIFDNMFSSTVREVLSNFENLKAEAEENGANFKSSVKWGTSLGASRVGNDTNFENIANLRDTLIDENVKNGTLRESKTINRNNIMAKIDTGGYDMSRALNTDASGKGEFRKISPEENKYFDSVFSRKDSNKREQSGAQDGELNENKIENRSKSTAANIFDLETILSQKGKLGEKDKMLNKNIPDFEGAVAEKNKKPINGIVSGKTSKLDDGLQDLNEVDADAYPSNAAQILNQVPVNKRQNLDLLKKDQGSMKNFDPKGGQTKPIDNTKGALFSGEVELKSKSKVRDFDEKFDKRSATDDPQPVNKQDILPNQVANPGDAILGNLRHTSEVYSAGAAQGVEAQTKTIQNIGVEVAERIIASHAALNAKQEVRISLKDSILPQTEVRIAKNEKSGVLQVGFFTSADRSAEFLATNQSNLRLHLLENLRNVSDVEVSIHHDAPNNQQSDGRSKQEYVGDSSEDDEDYRR